MSDWRPSGGLALLIWFAGTISTTAAEAPPPGASSCSGCHATSGAVDTSVPRLVGRPAPEIISAMREFRSGERPATVMDRIAKGFSDAEAATIADWYARQKP
jgi:cytochrome subunit of sulfide dehydrogenase